MAKKTPPPPPSVGFGALGDALRARGLRSEDTVERTVAAAAETEPALPSGKVLVRREVKGRKGKTVTTVARLPLRGPALDAWVASVRGKLGAGASVEGETVVIQGDHVDRILALLAREGR